VNRALSAGLSAIAANQQKMDVTANNLANVSTTGFKASRVAFQDTYYDTLQTGRAASGNLGGTSPMQIGSGVAVGAISTLMSQGTLETTGAALDAAIDGAGMFCVKTAEGGMAYTRDGCFQLDSSNTLVMASTGLRVQGWTADAAGGVDASGPVGDISFPLNSMRAPRATTTAALTGNLDSTTAADTAFDPWTPVAADPASTVTSSVTIYDSLGETHDVALSFTKTDTNEWLMTASCEGATTYGRVTFDANGAVQTVGAATSMAGPDTNRPNLDIDLSITPTNGSAAITLNLPLERLTQLNAGSTACVGSQDGFSAATLNGITIGDGGLLIGTYSDGQTMALGQVALATFSNEAGLQRLSTNLYTSSVSSGLPLVGTADTGGRGGIVSQSLEGSNTDMTAAFLDMLVTQRAYQANAKVINTANSLLDEALQLGR